MLCSSPRDRRVRTLPWTLLSGFNSLFGGFNSLFNRFNSLFDRLGNLSFD
jgi:hypothetical protein